MHTSARDDTLRSKDKKRLVCARNWTVFIYIFFASDPPHGNRQEPQGLIWFCLCMFFFSQSRESHWLQLYDWQTATVWVKNLCLCSTEEKNSPTSWMKGRIKNSLGPAAMSYCRPHPHHNNDIHIYSFKYDFYPTKNFDALKFYISCDQFQYHKKIITK